MKLKKSHKALIAAAFIALILGAIMIQTSWHLPFWQGSYCSIGLATTEGCNYSPVTKVAQIVAVILMIVTIPLLASVFALLQNLHLHKHLSNSMDKKLDDKFETHRQEMTDLINNSGDNQ
jgi:hypothetical protein